MILVSKCLNTQRNLAFYPLTEGLFHLFFINYLFISFKIGAYSNIENC